MTTVQETVPKSELELQEVDANNQEGSGEATKELYRREENPQNEENPALKSPKSPGSSPSSPRTKTPSKVSVLSSKPGKKVETSSKKSNSGIPLRLKSGSNMSSTKGEKKASSYRPPPSQTLGPVINRNTLEMQFINNKKRLLQLHAELVEKQRPLVDMHKSLMRTKKQLEEMGKRMTLEDLKVVSLKIDDIKSSEATNSDIAMADAVTNLRGAIDVVLESCMKLCKRCLLKRDHVIKVLEDMSKSVSDPSNFEVELEEMKREKGELEGGVEIMFRENEAKITELLANWQKVFKLKNVSHEAAIKISELEDVVMQQQKSLSEGEDNMINLTRKFEDKKATLEKTITELHDKTNKLEDDLKREKRSANENLMKTRNLRGKVTELEVRTKEAEEKHNEALKKLSQLQEQLRRKEVQWLKEKDDFKKNEELLQQKFTEKQSQFDTRLKDMERMQKTAEVQQQNFYDNVGTQLEMKDHEVTRLEKEKEILLAKALHLEDQMVEMKKQLEDKDKEIDNLTIKNESIPAIEYKPDESHWMEIMEYKQKINDLQTSIQEQSEQITKMQSSLKAHAQLAAGLKLEKDNAIKYSNKLRNVLKEAREEIELKNKAIYKTHEKLVLKDKMYDKLKAEMKRYEPSSEYSGEKWTTKNRCQICLTDLGTDKPMDCSDAEVGNSNKSAPQYVSDSLIGMSVKKVDHLRARLDNLKKMKLPFSLGKNHTDFDNLFSHETNQPNKLVGSHLRKQIELRGKLYQILQKHADQSCEDFINLLKLSASNSKEARGVHELKPSNTNHRSELGVDYSPQNFSSNIKITESFAQYVDHDMFNQIYDNLNESFVFESD